MTGEFEDRVPREVGCERGYQCDEVHRSTARLPLRLRFLLHVACPQTGRPAPKGCGYDFFAFGDGAKDEDLVKCGIQLIQGTAVIAEDATN